MLYYLNSWLVLQYIIMSRVSYKELWCIALYFVHNDMAVLLECFDAFGNDLCTPIILKL